MPDWSTSRSCPLPIRSNSKYLLDAITELGCWEDDNDDHVKTEIILPTELDRANGRVEVTIRSV